MEWYQIITDEKRLDEFINFLPDLEEGETYVVALFARNKYCKDAISLKSNHQQIKRFNTSKDYLKERLSQLEVKHGCYKYKGVNIPQEALAVYITLNPRSQKKAAVNTLKRLVDQIASNNERYNLKQQVLTELQRCESRRVFLDFDFDGVSLEQHKEKMKDFLNKDAYQYLVTRGGFHLIVHPSKIEEKFKKTFYKNICSMEGSDNNSKTVLVPIPGTYQGGFTPFLTE